MVTDMATEMVKIRVPAMEAAAACGNSGDAADASVEEEVEEAMDTGTDAEEGVDTFDPLSDL